MTLGLCCQAFLAFTAQGHAWDLEAMLQTMIQMSSTQRRCETCQVSMLLSILIAYLGKTLRSLSCTPLGAAHDVLYQFRTSDNFQMQARQGISCLTWRRVGTRSSLRILRQRYADLHHFYRKIMLTCAEKHAFHKIAGTEASLFAPCF